MRAVLALFVVTSLAGVAAAQQNPMSYAAVTKAKAGTWAEYTMSQKGQTQTMKMKYALVGKTDKTMALEVDMLTPMGAVLSHMDFEASGPETWKVVRGRVQMGTQTKDLSTAELGDTTLKKNDTPGKLIGTESVKTSVGTFECKHYQTTKTTPQGAQTIDLWMNDKVLPVGMVKMTIPGGAEAVLTATGSDAKAKMDISKPVPTATPTPAPAPTPTPTPTPTKK